MSDHYYRSLTIQEKRVYEAALRGLTSCRAAIRTPRTGMDAFTRIMTFLSYDHPEIFYVNFHRFPLTSSGTGMTWNVDYLYPKDRIPHMIRNLEETAGRILSADSAVRRGTELEKCRWIHDTLVKNVSYDHEGLSNPGRHPEAYSVVGVFRDRKAVCEGISLAAALLGERLGLDLPVVAGKGISDLPGLNDAHAWNLAFVNGKCAHMDVTWDMCISAPLHFVRYDYFCIPDDMIRTDHIYSGTPACIPGSGLSFFEQTHRRFTELHQCETYISAKLGEGRRIFYFRLEAPDAVLQNADERLKALLLRKAAARFPFGAVVESSHKPELGIFFYRISER